MSKSELIKLLEPLNDDIQILFKNEDDYLFSLDGEYGNLESNDMGGVVLLTERSCIGIVNN